MIFKYFKTSDKNVNFPESYFYYSTKEELYYAREENNKYMCEVEINSLEDLFRLMKDQNCSIIIHKEGFRDCPVIEIYDDYRE